MLKRWGLAVVAVAALVYAFVPLPTPSSLGWFAGATTESDASPDKADTDGSASFCPPNAKKANLDFTINDMNGNPVRLSDYKGKVILLDFWATWCGPCRIEIPHFVELQEKYGPKGLVVLGFSVDDTVERLKPFASEFKMNYPVLVGLGRDDVREAFGPIWAMPTTLLISRDGRICRRNTGIQGKERYERDIQALL
ncbi:MAG TPA: TlpA disulfide reductase family protein [Vicinamibacterales bacterium]|nr:TlpA disulfide reductase family protein [Vicinamibacterales bacterium]